MATVKKQINVPKDVHRHIIGAAGAVIRELQTTHSVKYVLLDDRALAVLASWISSPARWLSSRVGYPRPRAARTD